MTALAFLAALVILTGTTAHDTIRDRRRADHRANVLAPLLLLAATVTGGTAALGLTAAQHFA